MEKDLEKGKASWRSSTEGESRELGRVQLEAASAEVAADMERRRLEAMRAQLPPQTMHSMVEEARAAAAERAKTGRTMSTASTAAAAAPGELKWKDKDACEAAAKERSELEKIAKEMADLASTRQQERRTSASPKDLQDYVG